MKKIVITLLSVAAATTMYGQGSFAFNDFAATAAIKIGASNGVSGEGSPGFFVGSGYTASLYYGASSATQFSQLTYFPVPGGDPVFFGTGIADADQSAAAGIFDGGSFQIPGATGTVMMSVAVWWNGAGANGVAHTYAQALADGYNTGISPLLPIVLSTSADPSTYQALDALASFTVSGPSIVPEPTTLALCGLGAASLLLLRRKK